MEEEAALSSLAAGHGIPRSVNLRIISPSTNVPSPLLYNDLALDTTVGEIKARLRGELTLPPSPDVNLRLIYRGRVLDVDSARLLDVFGAVSVSYSDLQLPDGCSDAFSV